MKTAEPERLRRFESYPTRMMLLISLLTALFGPQPVQCSTGCMRDFKHVGKLTCFYRLQMSCARNEFICRDTDIVVCEPINVDLGVDTYRETGDTVYLFEASDRPVTDSHIWTTIE